MTAKDSTRARFGPVVGAHVYCGPTALSVVSGVDTAEIERMILEYRASPDSMPIWPPRDLRRVVGVTRHEIQLICKRLGLLPVRVSPECRSIGASYSATGRYQGSIAYPTFAQWMRDTADARGQDVYIVNVTGHFITVCGDMIMDNNLSRPQLATAKTRKLQFGRLGSYGARGTRASGHYRRARVREAFCIMRP